MTYFAKVQVSEKTFKGAAERFFQREVPNATTHPAENSVWVTFNIEADDDLKAGEKLYNILTRLEMDVSMRERRSAIDDPLQEGLSILMEDTGRLILVAGLS